MQKKKRKLKKKITADQTSHSNLHLHGEQQVLQIIWFTWLFDVLRMFWECHLEKLFDRLVTLSSGELLMR